MSEPAEDSDKQVVGNQQAGAEKGNVKRVAKLVGPTRYERHQATDQDDSNEVTRFGPHRSPGQEKADQQDRQPDRGSKRLNAIFLDEFYSQERVDTEALE